MAKTKEIKVIVEYTPGYQKRYTEAVLRAYERRERQGTIQPPKRKAG